MLYVKFITGCLATALLLGGCTKETEQKGADPVTPDADNSRRKVLMTLKNKLSVKPVTSKAASATAGTKAETPIATAAENAISTLDVYVFGATQENGNYTFLERFAYRADANDKLPQDATELQLNTTDADGNETNGLLKLKKGLFVKLYCIANNTAFIDPANNKEIMPADFTPITFAEGEDGNPKLAAEGSPHESTFISWHTRLLTATVGADTLATPLAMAGVYTTPIDLTSFDNSARVQIGFKLTRLAARFDIDNKAGDSRFIIETVSMGNGRRGSGFFPIRVYGDLPKAKPDELITYPERAFYGDNANNGLCTGAFYAYPSPKDDKAFLILKGKYKVNETEMKNVSYQIPFTQQAPDGNAAWLDIANNHRYTIAITQAAPYHLDANISVADWANDGSIDEFKPETNFGDMEIDIPDPFKVNTKYDPDTRSVSMSIKAGSTFDATINTPAALFVDKKYAGGPSAQQYDWLEVSKPKVVTKTAPMDYTYTFSVKDAYAGSRYPRAILRFINTMTGGETTLTVEAVSVPQANATPQEAGNRNSFDADLLEASMYRVTGSKVNINISCPDGTIVGSMSDWLDMKIVSTNTAKTTFQFFIKDGQRDVAADEGFVIFLNKKENSMETPVTIKLLDASISPNFKALGGTDNNYVEPAGDVPGNVNMTVNDDNTFTVSSLSLDGVKVGIDFDGHPAWLKHNGLPTTKAGSKANEVSFSLVESEIAKGTAQKATVTLQNQSGGKDFLFTVTPIFKDPVVTTGTVMSPDINNYDAGENKLYLCLQPAGKTSVGSIKVKALGGSQLELPTGIEATLTSSNEKEQEYELRLAGKDQSTPNTNPLTLKVMNKSDNTKYKEIILQPVLPEITNVKVVSPDNSVSLNGTNITTKLIADNTFSLNMKAVGGKVSISKKPDWLTVETPASLRTTPAKGDATFTFKVKNNATSFAEADLVLVNDAGGAPYTFKVKPAYQKPQIKAGTMDPAANNLQGTTLNLYYTKSGTTSDATITLSALGGTTIEVPGGVTVSKTSSDQVTDSYTIKLAGNTAKTPENAGPYTITVKNKSDNTQSVPITLYFKSSMPVFTTDKGSAIKFVLQGNKYQHDVSLNNNAVFYGTNGSYTLTVSSPSGLKFSFGDQKDPSNSASTYQDVKQTKTWTQESPTDVYVVSFKSTATFNPTKNIWYLYFEHNDPKFQRFELDEYIYFPVCLGKVPYPIVNANTTTTKWWCNLGKETNQTTAKNKADAIGSGWHIPTLAEYKALVGFTDKPATVTDANWYTFSYPIQTYMTNVFGTGRGAFWLPDTNATFEIWISDNKGGCSGIKSNTALVVVK